VTRTARRASRHVVTLAVLAVLATLAPTSATTRADATAKDDAEAPAQRVGEALLAIPDADPLELERVVQRFGDAELRALLARPGEVAVCLAATRAAPMLRRPELALEALVGLAEGRDSLLAPAAARAALTIALRLDADTLASHELRATELAHVRSALRSLAERETAGADIRLAAGTAAEALSGAGVP
jgi:hypothetical protein